MKNVKLASSALFSGVASGKPYEWRVPSDATVTKEPNASAGKLLDKSRPASKDVNRECIQAIINHAKRSKHRRTQGMKLDDSLKHAFLSD